jgi:hypothetical protein
LGSLTWRADYAPKIAEQLTNQFKTALKKGYITFRPNTAVSPLPVRIPAWDKLTESEQRRLYIERYNTFIANEDPDQQFALYLICTGFGRENCSLPPFAGFPFWSTDPIQEPAFGGTGKQARILISGGGDGAQQDLLRLAFMNNATEIFNKVVAAAESSRDGADWGRQIASGVARIQSSEIELRGAGKAYDQLVNSISPRTWNVIKTAIANMLRPEFLQSKVTFVFSETYLPRCFPLNRVLTLILRRFMLEDHRIDIFLPDTSVGPSAKPCAPHMCQSRPVECWALPHTVDLGRPHGTDSSDFDIILIRHGLLPT